MKRVLIAILAVLAAAVAWPRFSAWQRNWGATIDEREGDLAGDEFVASRVGQTTRAITINARPEHVWPWLAQMGYRRGGLYSWDFLDIAFHILDRPSAKEVLPEFQAIAAGDVVPVGVGPAFPVLRAETNEVLVLGSGDPSFPVSWQTILRPLEGNRTRLITRNRIAPPPGLRVKAGAAVLDVAAFIMVVRWLQVLKERGEGLASGRYS